MGKARVGRARRLEETSIKLYQKVLYSHTFRTEPEVQKMSEKKVVSRNLAVVFGIVGIVLLVGLVGVVANYTMVINNKDTIYRDYSSAHSHSNSDYDSLQSSYDGYVATHHHTDAEYDSMWTPYLIKVDLKANDNRPWPWGTPYLNVNGYLCNVNKNWAFKCKLHVVASQSDGVVAIDTYITLGTIAGESWTSIDSNIYYSGSALTSWTITPEWTDNP